MDKELWQKMTEYTPLSITTNFNNHPNIIKIEENIWVIKNFISQETIDKYLNYINNIKEETWWERNKDWWVGKYIMIDQHSALSKESDYVIKLFKQWIPNNVYVGAFGSIHRLSEGQGMFIHTDNPTEKRELYDENKNIVGMTGGHNNYCILAAVLYLSDFNGGELFFPEIGIDYKGNPGDLVVFPGTGKRYDHGVRPVKPGPVRYITTGFGYDLRVKDLKEKQYVFEDPKNGEMVVIEPSKVMNNVEEAMKLPPRPIS
jgi:hypothetical protein